MKLLTYLRCLTVVSVSFGSTQFANAVILNNVYPYLGIQAITYKSDFKTDPTMVGVVGGVQFNDQIGLEFTWTQSTQKLRFHDQAVADTKVKMYGTNVTFQSELGRDFYAKSSLGYAQVKTDLKVVDQDLGVVKIGAGYQFNPDLAAEIMYIHTEGSKKEFESIKSGVGVQVKYYF